ncbi:MAG: hypothetical protein QXM92_03350 [Candidatus Anstonellales archaeon]
MNINQINDVINSFVSAYPNILSKMPKHIIILHDTAIMAPSRGTLVLGLTRLNPSPAPAPATPSSSPPPTSSCCYYYYNYYYNYNYYNNNNNDRSEFILIPSYGLRKDVLLHELIHFNGIRSEILTRMLTNLLLTLYPYYSKLNQRRRTMVRRRLIKKYIYSVSKPDPKQFHLEDILRLINATLHHQVGKVGSYNYYNNSSHGGSSNSSGDSSSNNTKLPDITLLTLQIHGNIDI